MREPVTVVGLDVGGSTSRAQLARGEHLVREVTGPTASVSSEGLETACRVLRSLLEELDVDAADAVCLGTAGSGAPEVDEQLRATVREVVDTPIVTVVNDAELLLPAAGHDEGVALVAGTGMKVFGLIRGRRAFAGGWGFLLGDEGSGYWIVREAVRTVLAREDLGEPRGELGDRLFDALGITSAEQLIERFHTSPAPRQWAQHVPLVLGTDDPAREAIVDEGARSLAGRVGDVLRLLDAPSDAVVVLAGGVLAKAADVAGAVKQVLLRERPALRVEVLRHPPVNGAVRLARRAATER